MLEQAKKLKEDCAHYEKYKSTIQNQKNKLKAYNSQISEKDEEVSKIRQENQKYRTKVKELNDCIIAQMNQLKSTA